MITYCALGIGDACAIDSLLTQEERNNISELAFACKFGPKLASLFKSNPFYPNLTSFRFISIEDGEREMRKLDPTAVPFFHFRCDANFQYNFQIGKKLLKLDGEELNIIDAAALFQSNREFNNSSFINNAKHADVEWNELDIKPGEYILFHYPTSTRPRSDIASINEQDWAFVNKLSQETGNKVVVVTDTPITPPLNNYIILQNYPIKSLVALAAYANFYAGCDSWLAILCSKVLPVNKLFVKSHKPNIQTDILTNTWQQKYFLPKTPQEIAQFYKSYIGY